MTTRSATETPVLEAQPRSVLGKKVKILRRQGILPANVYGPGMESIPIQTDARGFAHFITTDAIRGVFRLKIAGDRKRRNVILRGVERQGGTGAPIHAEFLQVDMKRPVWVTVPLNFIGQAPAVHDLAGTLVRSQETVRVRCLPADIPKSIDVDLSRLETFSDTITVATLEVPPGVEMLIDPEVVLATVVPPRVVATAEQLAAEGEEGEEAQEGVEAAEDADEGAGSSAGSTPEA